MVWYKFSKLFIKLANEYWFHDNEVDYADGDVGNRNHEMIAESYLVHETIPVPYFMEDQEDISVRDFDFAYENDEDFKDFLREKYDPDVWWDHAYGENYLLWLLTGQIDQPSPVLNELLNAVKDPRKYMVDKKGWIRVRADNIETYNLDQAHLNQIVNGLRDVYGDEVENMKFNFEITSTGKYFEDVPFHEIESGKIRNRMKEVSDIPLPKIVPPKSNYYNSSGG